VPQTEKDVALQIVPVENIVGRKAVEGGKTCLRKTAAGEVPLPYLSNSSMRTILGIFVGFLMHVVCMHSLPTFLLRDGVPQAWTSIAIGSMLGSR
jgi:hypothetical protein